MLNTPDFLRYKIVGDSFTNPRELEARKGVWRFDLTEDGESWLDVFMLPENLLPSPKEFEVLWNLRPEEKGKVKIMGKVHDTPRWQQSYLKKYWFSGMTHEPLPLPPEVRPYLDYSNESQYPADVGANAFNEALLNWYQDGS